MKGHPEEVCSLRPGRMIDMGMNKKPGFIEITELDAELRSCWD